MQEILNNDKAPQSNPSRTAPALNSTLPPIAEGLTCPQCGYDARGLTSARCPECGLALEVLRTNPSRLPWAYRRSIGTLRAFWRTAWRVTRSGRVLAEELDREVGYADSQRFRWLLLGHALGTFVVPTIAVFGISAAVGSAPPEESWWIAGGILLALSLWFTLLPGLASYFCQPRSATVERQNRAIALSYYAWSPSAFTPVALLPLGLGALLAATTQPFPSNLALALIVAGWVLPVAIAALCIFRLKALLRKGLGLSAGRTLVRTKVFGLLALVLLGLCALFAASLFLPFLVYESMRL